MKSLFTLGAAAGVLIAASVGSASAASLTVSPSGAGLSDAANFTFTGIRTSDFSSINLTSTGGGNFSFTEKGYLPIATFDPGNFTPPGLNGAAGATPYGLYLAFTGSGTVSTVAPGFLAGGFSTLSYTLMGDAGFTSSFNHFDANHQVFCTGCGGDIVLANGTLLPGGNDLVTVAQAGSNTPIPNANVDLAFNGTSGAFFKAPSPPFSLALITEFSNTTLVTNRYTTDTPAGVDQVITIGTTDDVGGSGTGQFLGSAIPEPASMMLLGTGLLGIGLIRRRSSKS